MLNSQKKVVLSDTEELTDKNKKCKEDSELDPKSIKDSIRTKKSKTGLEIDGGQVSACNLNGFEDDDSLGKRSQDDQNNESCEKVPESKDHINQKKTENIIYSGKGQTNHTKRSRIYFMKVNRIRKQYLFQMIFQMIFQNGVIFSLQTMQYLV